MSDEHYCPHAVEIGVLMKQMKEFDKDINGNGKPGLRDTVTEMNVTNNLMAKDLSGIKTSMSVFAKFTTEYNAVKSSNNKRTILAMGFLTLIFAGITLLTR